MKKVHIKNPENSKIVLISKEITVEFTNKQINLVAFHFVFYHLSDKIMGRSFENLPLKKKKTLKNRIDLKGNYCRIYHKQTKKLIWLLSILFFITHLIKLWDVHLKIYLSTKIDK